MKKYTVIFHPDAETDIASSYQWGCRVWGEQNAKTWVQQLRRTIKRRLTSLPLSCPVAPESAELRAEVRQLIVQRYRVLFIVQKRTVIILHLRGAWFTPLEPTEKSED